MGVESFDIGILHQRVGEDITRCRKLLDLYDTITAPLNFFSHQWPPADEVSAMTADDMLRMLVVFMHATLEGAIREAVRHRLLWDREAYRSFCKAKKVEAFISWDIAKKYPDAATEDLLRRQIDEHLDGESYGSLERIIATLENVLSLKSVAQSLKEPIEITESEAITPLRPMRALGQMIKRRHNVAHQLDRVAGATTAPLLRITRDDVVVWLTALETFLASVTSAHADQFARIAEQLANDSEPSIDG